MWSGIRISEIAKYVGMEEDYSYFYWLSSKYIHTSTLALGKFVDQDENSQWKLNTAPSKHHCDTSLIMEFKYFKYILDLVNEYFTVNIENDLEKLSNDLVRAINSYSNTLDS